MITVADYIANFLVERDVRYVFGYQGGAIMKVIDAIALTGKVEYVQNYHEQASGFCADAYARVTGKLGVAVATSGPGATNLITGIANAYLDSVPTLFITGQDYSSHVFTKKESVRLNGFQDLDIVQMVKPITKYATVVKSENEIRRKLEKAYHLAISGRPGAVLLDIPIDIQFKQIDPNALKSFEPEPVPYELSKIPAVVEQIQQAKRPLILAGGGVQLGHAEPELKAFAKLTGIPVVTTLNGVDAVEGAYSFAGLHGNTFANLAVQNCDLLLVLGARLGQQQVGKSPQNYTTAKVVHVDVDQSEFERVMPEAISLQSDLLSFLRELIRSSEGGADPRRFDSWRDQIESWKKKYDSTTHLNPEGLDPVKAIKSIWKFIKEDAIVTNDVGQNQMWVAQAFRKKRGQRLLNSSGLGSMGYSLPASIAAKLAKPDNQVIAFSGDGGFQMNLQELMMIAQRRLGIKCIVLHNNTLGMMRMSMKKYYNCRYVGAEPKTYACVDLQKLAYTYGLEYIAIGSESELDKLAEPLQDDKPYIIEFKLSIDSALSNRYDESAIFEKEKLDG